MMDLKEFNSKYVYKSDKEKYNTNLDIWEIPEEINGKIEGDCESYCRFLKNNIEGFKDWDYYYCKLKGNGHCILSKNGDVIDCNIKYIVTLEQYCKIYEVSDLKKYNPFVVFSKILFSKIFLMYYKNKP